jgi:hypothetical protein
MIIKLRGHHLFCLQGFQGYGYSENFIENMINIKEDVEKLDTEIVLCDYPDDICKCCPNLNGELCKNVECNANIIEMDQKVLIKLDYFEDNILAKDLFEKINGIFNSKKDIENICGSCNWLEKCLFYQKFL